ncbi:hypothetical protein ADMFC3_27330 [Geovibrio sp. ADMFC3]|nr:hypothetical protein [Deferribacteraceae bacterium]
MELIEVEVNQLKEHPDNKKYFDDIVGIEFEELKESIREKGFMNPLVIVRENSGYLVIAGNQRLRAARELGITSVPCLIKEFHSKNEEIQFLVEDNLRRRHLTPVQRIKAQYAFYKTIDGKNKTEKVKRASKILSVGKYDLDTVVSVEENMIPELKSIFYKLNFKIKDVRLIANMPAEEQYKFYEAVKECSSDDILSELNALVGTIRSLNAKQKALQKENIRLKTENKKLQRQNEEMHFVTVQSVSRTEKKMSEIVATITRINLSIFELLRLLSECDLSLKELALADYDKLDVGFFDDFCPPPMPIFRLVSEDVIKDYLKKRDKKEVEEMLQTYIFRYLRV